MDDLVRLQYLVSGKGRPDLSLIRQKISSIFDTDLVKLRVSQLEGLASVAKFRRAFCSMGVGEGKTYVSFLAPIVARSHRALLMLPSNLIEKTIKLAIPEIEKNFNLKLDWCCLSGMSQTSRRNMMNKHRITIFPYSFLSVEDTEELLELSKADMIISDECHSLKDYGSAKTKRFMKYIEKYPDCDLVFMSATSVQTTILDYHHLITHCLKHLSPLPHDRNLAYEMQEVIAHDQYKKVAISKFFCNLAPKLKMSYGENLVNVELCRNFMRELFASSPATVLTENQSVSCSIFIDVIEMQMPDKLASVIKEIQETWCTPSGDELEDYLSVHNLLTQISSGFYYRLFWEPGTPEWVINNWRKRNEFVSAVRKFIKQRHRTRLDTPGLVERALEKDISTVSRVQPEYSAWKKSFVIGQELTERTRERIWESLYKIDEAVKWAKKFKHGIIWYKWDEVGLKLKEFIPYATYCPAGVDVFELNKSGILICSLAHAEGQNLQHHNRCLIFDIPESGADMEQLIGREHRQGQKEDCVFVDILVANVIDKANLKKVYLQSKYLHQTNQQQKFIIADWSTDEYVKSKPNGDDSPDIFELANRVSN